MRFLFFVVILSFSKFVVADLLSGKRMLCVEGQKNNTVCDIAIDSEGYVFDVAAQRRIFDSSEPSGALYSSSLYKLHDMYVMEVKSYSSAKKPTIHIVLLSWWKGRSRESLRFFKIHDYFSRASMARL